MSESGANKSDEGPGRQSGKARKGRHIMSEHEDRRSFLKKSVALSAGATLGLGLAAGGETGADANKAARAEPGASKMPMGQIGKLKLSRLISGGNLISGWAHSRDLRYVAELQRRYNSEEKVRETLALCEQHGINAIIADPRDKPMQIFKKHWNEGGKIQWIAEGHPSTADLFSNVQKSIDWGASAVYVQGAIGDRWLRDGHIDKLAEVVAHVKKQGVPAGIGAHELEVIIAAETGRYEADFYVKTLHHHNYWTWNLSESRVGVVENGADNYWALTPQETIEFFQEVKKPWIAFKTLAAGAIHPRSGFDYAFKGGADFICVGMFDFQVAEDAEIAAGLVAKYQQRERPWIA